MEWAARTYHWRLSEILWEIPAAQIALLLRQWSYAVAGRKGLTLAEMELFS